MLGLAYTAKTFAQRPSALLGVLDNVVALDLDNGCALMLARHEADAVKRAQDGDDSSESSGSGSGWDFDDLGMPRSDPWSAQPQVTVEMVSV